MEIDGDDEPLPSLKAARVAVAAQVDRPAQEQATVPARPGRFPRQAGDAPAAHMGAFGEGDEVHWGLFGRSWICKSMPGLILKVKHSLY